MSEEQGSEEKGQPSGAGSRIDKWYEKIAGYLSGQISRFVAFLFFILALGAVFAWWVLARFPEMAPVIILAPAMAGLLAYYNRDFATVLFALFLVAFIFL